MKKYLSFLLACVLVLGALSGCSSSGNDAAETPEPAVTEPAQETTPDAAETPEAAEFTRGTVTDGVYTNDFAAIAFAIPDGWIVADDDTITQIMGAGTSFVSDDPEQLQATLEAGSAIDMLAYDEATGENITVTYEDLTGKVLASSLTEKAYITLAANSLSSLGNMSAELTSGDYVTLGGQQYYKAILATTYTDYDMTVDLYYYVRLVGPVAAVISGQSDLDACFLEYTPGA